MEIVAEGAGPRKHQLAEGEGAEKGLRKSVHGPRDFHRQLSPILPGTSRGQESTAPSSFGGKVGRLENWSLTCIAQWLFQSGFLQSTELANGEAQMVQRAPSSAAVGGSRMPVTRQQV